MVLRRGGTYDNSPAIYRRVRYYTGLRPGGTPTVMRKAEGPPMLNSLEDTPLPAHHIDIAGVGVALGGDPVRDRLRARRFAPESL